MFEKFGMLASLLGNQGKLKDEITKFQTAVGQLSAEATAGAGYVTVKVNGRMEVQAVRISDEAMQLNDREMLEDLIAAATNQAMVKVRELVAAETAKMASNMGLPPGMLGGLPGMG
jgi:DNA-binding YbaB/EbfC family protein